MAMWDEPVSLKPQGGEGGLNAAIDEVAREMTEGSPADAAAFRRQVLARIEISDAPRRSWRAAVVLSPIAVAAAIVLALFVMRRSSVVFDGAATGPVIPAVVPAAQPDTQVVILPCCAGPGDHAQKLAVRQPVVSRSGVAASVSAPEPNDVASIAVASIAVAPLAVGALSPDPISIERLDAVTPITVAPLDTTDMQRRFE
jgi:uncharacterized membrane protein YgcG